MIQVDPQVAAILLAISGGAAFALASWVAYHAVKDEWRR